MAAAAKCEASLATLLENLMRQNRLKTSELLEEVGVLEAKVEKLHEKRNQLSPEASVAKPLDKNAIEAMAKKYLGSIALKEWRKRRTSEHLEEVGVLEAKVEGLCESLENYPKTKTISLEDIYVGVGENEEAGVSLPLART